MNSRHIHEIHTAMNYDGETTLQGSDEHGNDFKIVMDTYEMLQWFDDMFLENARQTIVKRLYNMKPSDTVKITVE